MIEKVGNVDALYDYFLSIKDAVGEDTHPSPTFNCWIWNIWSLMN